MNQNPYSPPPPSPPGQNPYGMQPAPPPQQAPYANPYANPNAGQPQGAPPGMGYNPYAPPSAAASWGSPGMANQEFLAERGTRLGAKILDNMLLAGSAVIPALLGMVVHEFLGVALGMTAFLAFAIYQCVLISTTGQSVAKKWLGIRIVMNDGSPVGFVHGVLLRGWVMAVINQIIPFVALIDALMIFGDERRCLHDHLGSTKVVVA